MHYFKLSIVENVLIFWSSQRLSEGVSPSTKTIVLTIYKEFAGQDVSVDDTFNLAFAR